MLINVTFCLKLVRTLYRNAVSRAKVAQSTELYLSMCNSVCWPLLQRLVS